jgi:hypothetical protein
MMMCFRSVTKVLLCSLQMEQALPATHPTGLNPLALTRLDFLMYAGTFNLALDLSSTLIVLHSLNCVDILFGFDVAIQDAL